MSLKILLDFNLLLVFTIWLPRQGAQGPNEEKAPIEPTPVLLPALTP